MAENDFLKYSKCSYRVILIEIGLFRHISKSAYNAIYLANCCESCAASIDSDILSLGSGASGG